MDISKQDKLWKDAMETAAASGKSDVCEDLLRFFVSEGRKDCVAALLYNCYDFLEPDVVLEVCWKNQMLDFAMPFMIQTMKEYKHKVDRLESSIGNSNQDQDGSAVHAHPHPHPIGGATMIAPMMASILQVRQ